MHRTLETVPPRAQVSEFKSLAGTCPFEHWCSQAPSVCTNRDVLLTTAYVGGVKVPAWAHPYITKSGSKAMVTMMTYDDFI